jgi:putative oxidoreductase
VSDAAGVIVLVGRVLFVLFPAWVSGYSFHLRAPRAAEEYARAMGFPLVALAGAPAGIWLLAASISVGLGIWPDVGALMLAAFMLPTIWWFHGFWRMGDPDQRQVQTYLFWRNVMILASCLVMFGFFAAAGEALRFVVVGPALSLR